MKNGFLFFLNMGKITTAARIALIPSALFIFRTVPSSPAFYFFIGLTVLSLVLALIHSPSDKAMQQALEHFYEDVQEKKKELCVIKDDKHYIVMRGYQKRGYMRLCRQLGTDIVYPHPLVLVHAQKEKRRFLLVAMKDLTKNKPIDYHLIDLTQEATDTSLLFEENPNNKKVAQVLLHHPRFCNDLIIYTKNDYHYRFLEEATVDLQKNK